MKKLLFITSVLLTTFSYGQISNGGQRICGNQFSANGVTGMTFSQALDFAGQVHNDYQENLLNRLRIIKPNFKDTNAIKSLVAEQSHIFFASKGLEYNESAHPLILGKLETIDFALNPGTFSSQAITIMNQFKAQLQGFDPGNDMAFLNTLNQLKESSLNLSDEREVFTVGIPVAIAINSTLYWKEKGQIWMDMFSKDDEEKESGPSVNSNLIKKPKVNLYQLGGSDAVGAVQGAIGGSAMGPFGALAGGILVSATMSLGNLVSQVIGSYVSWWPF